MPRPRGLLRVSGQVVVALIGIPLAALGVLLVLGIWFDLLGPGDALLGLALALIPLALVIAGIFWVDRWEREPRWMVAFALLWGAGFCALIGVFVGVDLSDAGMTGELVTAIVQAPIVEEVAKSLVLLIIVIAARRQLDGPVDGVVYAALTAAGFAFVENMLYFGVEFARVGDVPALFVIRGLMSPFAHVIFSACVGIAVGLAVRRGLGAWRVIGVWICGLVPAIGLHALWNGALYLVPDFFAYYLLIQLPLFIGMVWLVIWLRGQERQITVDRLEEFAAAGWLHGSEVDALATREGRSRALDWARRSGRSDAMKAYIGTATKLAFAGQRARASGGASDASTGAEVEQALEAFTAARAKVQS